jgi:hypothetical protein
MKRNIEINNKRQRRNIRDLPQSSDFIFNDNHKSLNVCLFFLKKSKFYWIYLVINEYIRLCTKRNI